MRNGIIKYILQNQVLVAILFVATAWLLFEIREVLIAIFVSYILMAAISPYVEFLRKHRVPKPIAILVPYLAASAFFVILVISLLPFFITQIQVLFEKLPSYINELRILNFSVDQEQINSFAAKGIGNVFSITGKVFGGIFSAISIFVISFYLLFYKDTVRSNFASLFPKNSQAKALDTMTKVEDKLGNWLRGQIVLSGFIGVFTWIILTILGVEFALPLAVLAGLLEIVPTIGPTIAAIPAIIVALTVSVPLAIVVAVSYVAIQLFESQLLVPRVMQKAVGLNPIIIILGIIIGGKLLGPIGSLLAIPLISLFIVVYKNVD